MIKVELLSDYYVDESEKFGKKLPTEYKNKVLSREVSHTKAVIDKFKVTSQKSSVRIFLTYLYCYENIKSFGIDLYEYDVSQFVRNFGTYIKTVRASGSHSTNIFVGLNGFFSFLKIQFQGNLTQKTINMIYKLDGKKKKIIKINIK